MICLADVHEYYWVKFGSERCERPSAGITMVPGPNITADMDAGGRT